MEKRIEIEENDCRLVFEVLEDGGIGFLHCQRTKFREQEILENQKDWYRLVEIQTAGEDHHGSKYTGTLPARGARMFRLSCERNI